MPTKKLTITQKELLRKLVQYREQGDLTEPFLIGQIPHPRKPGRFILYLPLNYGEQVILNDEFFNPISHDFQVLVDKGYLGTKQNNKGEFLYEINQDGINAVDDDFSEDLGMFEHILLESEQEELLILLVEASRNMPREKRRKFIVSQTSGGDSLIHPGVPDDKQSTYFGDIEILANSGFLNLGYGPKGSPNFDVTPLGYRYYKELKAKLGEPTEQMELTIRTFIDAHSFNEKYKSAYKAWSTAEELLWSAESEKQLTTIGHHCREALQEFADILVNQFKLQDDLPDKAKSIARLKAVLGKKKPNFGATEFQFLDALLSFWGAVNDLVQRQEHGAIKDGEKVNWEDARRVLFNTMIVMYEFDRAINSK